MPFQCERGRWAGRGVRSRGVAPAPVGPEGPGCPPQRRRGHRRPRPSSSRRSDQCRGGRTSSDGRLRRRTHQRTKPGCPSRSRRRPHLIGDLLAASEPSGVPDRSAILSAEVARSPGKWDTHAGGGIWQTCSPRTSTEGKRDVSFLLGVAPLTPSSPNPAAMSPETVSIYASSSEHGGAPTGCRPPWFRSGTG